MIFVATTLVLVFALFISSLMRITSRGPYILSVLIIAYGNIVFVGEVASLFTQISITFFLLFHFILLIIGYYFWRKYGEPSLLGPFANEKWAIWKEIPPFRVKPTLYILLTAVVLIYFIGGVLIITLPQNNYDSMTYHLSRVGYWMQYKTLTPWPTPNFRQTTSPINAELGLLWTILFWGTDQFTGFIQWISAIGIGIAIYGLSRLMGAKRSQGIYAALIWATLPQIILQSSTTQNDLVISFFFTSMLYFLFLGVHENKNEYLIVSGIALGLAFGTKVTILIVFPGLALSILMLLSLKKFSELNKILVWGISGISGIVIFGLFTYLQNQIFYGNPLSIPEVTSSITGSSPLISRLMKGVGNLILFFFQFLDFSGLPETIAQPLINIKSSLVRWILTESSLISKVSQTWSINRMVSQSVIIHEDTTWFGPLSFFIWIPMTIVQFWHGIRRRDIIRIGLVIIGIGFLISLSFLLSWSPYRGRYFVLAVSVLAPLIAFLYKSDCKWDFIIILTVILSIWIMFSTVLNNASKPLVGPNAIWKRTHFDIRMSKNKEMIPVIQMIDEMVPSEAVLATRLGTDHWDYVLFGKRFERTITQLDPHYLGIDDNFMQNIGANYLLTSPRERPFLEIPSGLKLINEASGWYLFEYSPEFKDLPISQYEEGALLGQSDSQGLLRIDDSLNGVVGVLELYAVDWDVESDESGGFKWIGEGLSQGLRGFLWSEEEIPVKISFHLQPGPSREDLKRNLLIEYFRYGAYGPIREGHTQKIITINGTEIYEMVLPLQKGLNEFRIIGLDYATIPVLPNGDPRPLLTRLQHINVSSFDQEPRIFTIYESLETDIQVSEQYLAEWGLEKVNNTYFQWLGEGFDQGFKGLLWSDKERWVEFVFHLAPGPSRKDLDRNLKIILTQYGSLDDENVYEATINFRGDNKYKIKLRLHTGLNELLLYALDNATIEILPNGDTRPLLIKLSKIDIVPVDE